MHHQSNILSINTKSISLIYLLILSTSIIDSQQFLLVLVMRFSIPFSLLIIAAFSTFLSNSTSFSSFWTPLTQPLCCPMSYYQANISWYFQLPLIHTHAMSLLYSKKKIFLFIIYTYDYTSQTFSIISSFVNLS